MPNVTIHVLAHFAREIWVDNKKPSFFFSHCDQQAVKCSCHLSSLLHKILREEKTTLGKEAPPSRRHYHLEKKLDPNHIVARSNRDSLSTSCVEAM